jgi:hypothetical protein
VEAAALPVTVAKVFFFFKKVIRICTFVGPCRCGGPSCSPPHCPCGPWPFFCFMTAAPPR